MPDFEIEDSLNCMVAGVDEAGRGPWAGPVVAGAVIIRDRNLGDELLKGLDDSKKISAKKRELLYEKLREEEKNGRLFIGIGQASAEEIDRCNILQATFAARKNRNLRLLTAIRRRRIFPAAPKPLSKVMRAACQSPPRQSPPRFIVTA